MIDNRKKYAPSKRGHKLYLSDASRELLEAESRRTTYPMSIVVDMLIQKHIEPERQDDHDTEDLFVNYAPKPEPAPERARPVARRRRPA